MSGRDELCINDLNYYMFQGHKQPDLIRRIGVGCQSIGAAGVMFKNARMSSSVRFGKLQNKSG